MNIKSFVKSLNLIYFFNPENFKKQGGGISIIEFGGVLMYVHADCFFPFQMGFELLNGVGFNTLNFLAIILVIA